jgi:regulator of RNase E activity RraA
MKEYNLTHSELLELKRWNTPTIYNGWEQITNKHINKEGFNLEPLIDYMPNMGPMIGSAITVVIEPSNPSHLKDNPNAWSQYREYVASMPGPKIVVVQDLDKPKLYGAFWGEVNSNAHRALGCVGTIIDGGIRDLDEMTNAGFKALSRGLCVGHAHSYPVNWDCEVEVFGIKVKPGQLIHADKHGFLVIEDEDQEHLLDAVRFMDSNECNTMIPAARDTRNNNDIEILERLDNAGMKFNDNVRKKFNKIGEW